MLLVVPTCIFPSSFISLVLCMISRVGSASSWAATLTCYPYGHASAYAMYSRRRSKSRKGIIRMDPNCAICNAPATLACDCEAKGLEMAVRQAEERMMRSIYSDIRSAAASAMTFERLQPC